MKVTVVGCGIMGSALARHFAKSHKVTLINRNRKKAESLAEEIGATCALHIEDAIKGADALVIAVKPKDFALLAKTIAHFLSKETLVLSILAGTSLAILRKHLPSGSVFRVMPNLALTVGEGVIGIVEEPELTQIRKEEIELLLHGLGILYWISESKMDAFAALTASAPAFIYVMVEAMIESGVFTGFSAEESRELVIQTFIGAIALLKDSKQHAAELKLQISSPGGMTIAGLKEMEKAKVRSGIWNAVVAAYEKSISMSSSHEKNG